MSMDGIEAFVEVVEARSFVRAAERLGMPPATLSAKIARLEKRLGVTLIQRTTRRLHVTPAGESYYGYCSRALSEMREAHQTMSALVEEPAGVLRLTAPVDLSQTILPGLVERFLQRCPKVSVELVITNRRLDLLEEGIDLAIRAGELADSRLKARRLFSAQLCLWGSTEYLARHGTPRRPEDLARHAFIGFPDRIARSIRLRAGRRSLPLPARPRIVCDDLETIRRFILRGNGIGLLPDLNGGDPRLVPVLPAFTTKQGTVSIVYPAQRFVPPAVRSFIDIATEEHGL